MDVKKELTMIKEKHYWCLYEDHTLCNAFLNSADVIIGIRTLWFFANRKGKYSSDELAMLTDIVERTKSMKEGDYFKFRFDTGIIKNEKE